MMQQPKDMPTVVVTNKKQLQDLIKETIAQYGPECDLNFIDVSKMKSMSKLFIDSKFNGDISKWNVSKVENMSEMFKNSTLEMFHKTPEWYLRWSFLQERRFK